MKRKENKGVQKKDKRVDEKNGIKRTSQPFYTVLYIIKDKTFIYSDTDRFRGSELR